MKLIKPSYEIWEQGKELSGVMAQIERAARVCYASEPKGEVGELLGKLIKAKHYAMLEHGTVYLYIPSFEGDFYQHEDGSIDMPRDVRKYYNNKYSKFDYEDSIQESGFYITTNYRVLVENNWLDDLKYLCEPTEYHEKRVTVHFTTNIGVSREFNRHRVDSIAEQSTRYCGLSKFENNLNIDLPSWINHNEVEESVIYNTQLLEGTATQCKCVITPEGKPNGFSQVLYELDTYYWTDIDWWLWANKCSELAYLKLIEKGWSPQKARSVLPLDTNTELIHTAFVSDWKHFFDLRAIGTTGKPHPDAEILAKPLMNEFIERRYLNGTSNS